MIESHEIAHVYLHPEGRQLDPREPGLQERHLQKEVLIKYRSALGTRYQPP